MILTGTTKDTTISSDEQRNLGSLVIKTGVVYRGELPVL